MQSEDSVYQITFIPAVAFSEKCKYSDRKISHLSFCVQQIIYLRKTVEKTKYFVAIFLMEPFMI